MAVQLRPTKDVPDNAQSFTGNTLKGALENAAQALGVGSIGEVAFNFDRAHFALGADSVAVLAWTVPVPEELTDARDFVRVVLDHLGDSSAIGASLTKDDQGRDTKLLTIQGPDASGGLTSGRAQSALRRILREGFGWSFDLRFNEPRSSKEDRLAKDVAGLVEKARKSGRPQRMRPMNSYDRRIAHQAVKEHDGMGSRSVGDGRNRQVEIYVEDSDDE